MRIKKASKGWRGNVTLDTRIKHDPQEDDPKLGPIIKQAYEEACITVCGEKKPRKLELGQNHAIWGKQKEILRAQGISWKTPAEMTPGTMID
ncbi:MAG: hypothetical protein WC242_00315 [Candidatus Paceibacterota bacterium]|jgi:hypothetical protein